MTNAQVAAFYGSLPPDEPAQLHVLNTDTLGVTTVHVTAATEAALNGDDGLDEDTIAGMIGQPLVRTE